MGSKRTKTTRMGYRKKSSVLPSRPEDRLMPVSSPVPLTIDTTKHMVLLQDTAHPTQDKKALRKTSTSSARKSTAIRLYELLAYGGILALLYLFIVALSPLPSLHLYHTPLATALPWTLLPSQVFFPNSRAINNSLPALVWLHPTLLGLTLVALTAIYAWTVWRMVRHSNVANNTMGWFMVLFGSTLLFGLLLLFQPALFSDDVFTYIFSGRLLVVYHVNPLNTAPLQFPGDPYLQWVVSGRNAPNIYGPLWLFIASILVSLSNGPVMTLLLFKSVALLSHLLNCLLVWAILNKIAPSRRLLGTLLYAWNPLAMLELAGSGHNEGILISIFLLVTLLYVYGRDGRSEFIVLLMLGVTGSMNLIAFLIAPLLLWFMVRTERSISRTLKGFCWRALVVLVPAIAFYLPFWRGASTFFAITSAVDMAHFVHSSAALLIEPTRWVFGLVAQWSQFPPVMQPDTAADSTLRASAILIFVLIYIHLFSRVRYATATIAGMRYNPDADQAMTLPGFDILLECWSSAIFWYLVLILGLFWPWYVLWALWTVVLRRMDGRTLALLLFSGTALLIYPLLGFAQSPLNQYQSLLTFGVPLVCLYIYRRRQVNAAMPEKSDSTVVEGKE